MLHGSVIRDIVIGIEGQHRTGQLVHHVLGGCLEYHVLKEAGGQLPVLIKHLAEVCQLLSVGELSRKEEIGYLLVAEAILSHSIFHQVIDVIAPEYQLSLIGALFTLVHDVAVYGADVGYACKHAGAVLIAQPPLHIISLVVFLVDIVYIPVSLIKA